MKNQIFHTGKNDSGLAVFVPRHNNGAPCVDDCISKAIQAARQAGVNVVEGVARKFAPTGYGFRDGGPEFQVWLKGQGLELCKSDRSGAWWTVVASADITKRDRRGIAIAANNKFSKFTTPA